MSFVGLFYWMSLVGLIIALSRGFVVRDLRRACFSKIGYKSNAGGHDVVFDEVLTINKDLMYGKLVVSVWDKDTFR